MTVPKTKVVLFQDTPFHLHSVLKCTFSRAYPLKNLSQSRSSLASRKFQDFIIRMLLKLNNHRFSGNDLITVRYFLSRFVLGADMQGISETQFIILLPSFFQGFVLSQLVAEAKPTAPEEKAVSCWSDATLYLLRNYAQNTHLSPSICDLGSMKQSLHTT